MNLIEAVNRACQEPTLIDALTWICVWESERGIDQARHRYGSGANGAGRDTCFKVCIESVMKQWNSYAVFRQDENGHKFVLWMNLSKDEAQRRVDEFESRKHKQIYWVEKINNL